MIKPRMMGSEREDNIKRYLRYIERAGIDWSHLAKDRE
jgi:hypothetical protein